MSYIWTTAEVNALTEIVERLVTKDKPKVLREANFWFRVSYDLEKYYGTERSHTAVKQKYSEVQTDVGVDVKKYVRASKEKLDRRYKQAKRVRDEKEAAVEESEVEEEAVEEPEVEEPEESESEWEDLGEEEEEDEDVPVETAHKTTRVSRTKVETKEKKR